MRFKECSKCKITKEFSHFYNNKLGRFGLDSKCKDCKNLQTKKYKEENPDTLIEVKCDNCGEFCIKKKKRHKQSLIIGYSVSCSKKCRTKLKLKKHYGDTVGFGFYMNLVRGRSKKINKDFNVDLIYLKNLFEEQNGLCNISGVSMILNKSSNKRKDKSLFYASLDRIDNDIGYLKGNVQFVCLGINYMKNTFSDKELITFLQSVFLAKKIYRDMP